MPETFQKTDNQVLDRVISARRSIRKFKPEAPSREIIESLLQAGLMAPFVGAGGLKLSQTRKFIVFKNGTPQMQKAEELILRQVKKNLKKLKFMSKIIPALRKNGKGFIERVEFMATNGIPGLKTAPYYIVVAEHKTVPMSQHQAISHVMENIWLKATACNLGFQLLSATSQMEKDRDFMKLLGLPFGEYKIDGCLVGYPDQTPDERENVKVNDITTWY